MLKRIIHPSREGRTGEKRLRIDYAPITLSRNRGYAFSAVVKIAPEVDYETITESVIAVTLARRSQNHAHYLQTGPISTVFSL